MSTEVRRFVLPEWRTADPESLKADLWAGLTVSLVAVPQALAYAQLAGLPPIHGLYAALIPTVIGTLFGSSSILSTGPVAMTSLLTAASIAPLAGAGTPQFVAYAVLLALLSGLFQLGFGLMRLGVLLNFLSHPVLMGFINAAAIIIGLSQMPMLIGIQSQQSEHFLLDIADMLSRFRETNLLTLGFGLSSLVALLFINVSYFEDAVIELEQSTPTLSHILVKGSGINQIDASGVEMLFNLVERFKSNGVTIVFSGLKEQTLDVMQRSGLVRLIGPANIFATDQEALVGLRKLWDPVGAASGDPVPARTTLAPSTVILSSAARKAIAVRPVYVGTGNIKILVPVDGSSASLHAVEAAIAMVKSASGGNIVLFNVPNGVDIGVGAGDVLISQAVKSQELDRFADVTLKPGIELCVHADIAFKTRKEMGPTAQTIVRIAADEEVDQIVMGSRTRSWLDGLVSRSVSAHVAELAKVPVTLVK